MSDSNDRAKGTPGAAERFTKAYDQLIGVGLSPRLVLLYGKLVYHAGKDGRCFPKWATLAEEIGVSVKNPTTVYRLLCELRALKLVEWKRRGRYSSNQYQVLAPDIAFLQRQTLQKRNVSDIARMQPIKEVVLFLKEVSKRPPTPTPPPSLCASDDARVDVGSVLPRPSQTDGYRAEWFELWWAIYWRRVARKSAEKAFRAHVKTHERFEQVMTATRVQTPTMLVREPDKRPHGATWINGERWNDEPSLPATGRKPPERQSSTVERLKARWGIRLADGERPI